MEAAGQTLPVAPASLPTILGKAAEYAKSDTLNFLARVIAGCRRRILRTAAPFWRAIATRMCWIGCWIGCAHEDRVCEAIDRAVSELNGNRRCAGRISAQQNYRLAYWKTADQQLGYRRFFDVNTLIGLRVEREYVFDETHALILKWLKQGVLDGVRVDHPDGLRDPKQYFERLRERAPEAWIVGEKILEPGEWLREDWPMEGTSGYDFLNIAMGVLVNREGLKKLGKHYARSLATTVTFPAWRMTKKLR